MSRQDSDMKRVFALAAAATLTLALGACNGTGPEKKPDTTTTAPTKAATTATTDEATTKPVTKSPAAPGSTAAAPTAGGTLQPGDVSQGGQYSGSIGGTPVAIDGAEVTCLGNADTMSMVVSPQTQTESSNSFMATVEGGKVTAMMLGSFKTGIVTFSADEGKGHAEVAVDGKNYQFTGESGYVNLSDPSDMGNKAFEISITCGA